MPTLKQTIFAFVLVFALLTTAAAQDASSSAQRSYLTITASASGERVRITAPSSVVQMHVEVYAASGEKLFDQEIRGGNVFDWHLQDGQAQRLAPGDYVCVVTAKSISGRLTQKIGTVSVTEKSVSVQTADSPKLSVLQTQAIGPVEENSSWTIAAQDEPQTGTVIANDGTDGQMIRGRGALTFRLGNFFSGLDTEQMRLTEAGNLGIGTSEPRAKLEVAGAIRAQRFLLVKPGQTSKAAGAAEQTTDAADSVQPLVAGTGTQNQIAKWTDNSGTLGNSGITETAGGFVGIGTASPGFQLHEKTPAGGVAFFMETIPGIDVFESMGTDPIAGPAFNFGYSGGTFGRGSGFFNARPDAGAVAPNPSLRFMTANIQRMIITNTGNVGIGTTAPLAKLDVRGDVFVGLPAVPDAAATPGNNIYVADDGVGIGGDPRNSFRIDSYINNLYLVARSGNASLAGAGIVFRTAPAGGGETDRMTIIPNGNIGIGTTSPTVKLDVNGDAHFTGKVGIGTTDPTGSLEVRTTSPGDFGIQVTKPNGASAFIARGDGSVFVGTLQSLFSTTTHVCTSGGELSLCSSAAEYVPTIDDGLGFAETADLVSLAPAVKNPYDDEHSPFAVVKSTAPCDDNLLGFIVNPESGADGKKLNDHYLPLAIYGYFPAKVTMESGAIKRGDPITSSSKPGFGMKATQACKIVGYALEDADQEGKIQVFSHLSEYTAPQVAALQAQLQGLRREKSTQVEALQTQSVKLQARLNALEQTVQRSTENSSLVTPQRSVSRGSKPSSTHTASMRLVHSRAITKSRTVSSGL